MKAADKLRDQDVDAGSQDFIAYNALCPKMSTLTTD